MEALEESHRKKPRSLKVRRNNTARRRARKKEEKRSERENVGNSNMPIGFDTAANTHCDDEGVENVMMQRKIDELEAEKSRLHKHAVYFHYRWKKSEKQLNGDTRSLTSLDRSHLRFDNKVGEGTFGTCYQAKYGSNTVAVKEIKAETLTADISTEAAILNCLRHPNLPILFGVCFDKSPFLIVTTFHGIEGNDSSTTMHNALCNGLVSSHIRPHWLAILHCIATAIQYIHVNDILHNDIKSNNIVVEKCNEGFSVVLVDFGKSTEVSKSKTYPEFDEETKKKYEAKFPYLAPELKNGKGTQTKSSDIYSFGYLMKLVSHTLSNRDLSPLYHQCKNTCPKDRPAIDEIKEKLGEMIKG